MRVLYYVDRIFGTETLILGYSQSTNVRLTLYTGRWNNKRHKFSFHRWTTHSISCHKDKYKIDMTVLKKEHQIEIDKNVILKILSFWSHPILKYMGVNNLEHYKDVILD